ncbi:MAG: outer membrane beta-barrel protein [Candidatus Scalindua sp.]
MNKWMFYLLLPMFAVWAFGSVAFAQEFDRDALKAELRAELKAELKKELLGEIKEEMKTEILNETKADVQEATLGLRDVMKSDFKAEIRAEIMEETKGDISSEIAKALGDTPVLGGLLKGVTIGGFIDTNFMYNLRNHGNGSGGTGNRNANGKLNFVGENEDNSFVLENFAVFLDKEATEEDPIGWQFHTYMGEKAQGITFFGPGNDAEASGDGAAGANDRFAIATANLTWKAPVFGKHIDITMGKYYTWIGYELVENIGNPNYTHAQTYNNGIPFTHMGLKFDVSEFLPSDKFGLTLFFNNGWDTYIDNNGGKTVGAYFTYTPNDDFFISLGGIYGPETSSKGTKTANAGTGSFNGKHSSDDVYMIDIVATYSLPQIDKLHLGANWDWGTAENNGFGNPGEASFNSPDSNAIWWAGVGYVMYDFTDNQMGAFRYEYFDDSDGAKGFGISLWTVTYTHNITINDHLMLRPEVRYNQYNVSDAQEALGLGISPSEGTNTADSETILAFGAEYIF